MIGADQTPDAPEMPQPWWQRMSPLAGDCYTALEVLHCTPAEYYRRTTAKERLLIRLYQAFRGEQDQMQEEIRRNRAEMQQEFGQQFRRS